MSAQPFGTGLSADASRFTLDYAHDGVGPVSIVGKFASADPAARELAAIASMYSREVQFYSEIAAGVNIRAPRPIYAEHADDGRRFCLLMEDLSPARTVDQIEGCTVEEARLAMQQAAALHASSWRRRELAGKPWLATMVEAVVATAASAHTFRDSFIDKFGSRLHHDELQAIRQVCDHAQAWAATLGDPVCLWHHDFRTDNLLFDGLDGSVPLATCDWQTLAFGPGVADVSYFLGTSLQTDVRRVHERELVGVYHDALQRGGVADYTFDDCWLDYRRHAIHGLFTAVHASGRSKRTDRGDALWLNWAQRTAAQVIDLESIRALG